MDKQERLRERYEDALFSIMMDELSTSLGEEALAENERLKGDPTAAVPERIDKKCMEVIRNYYRKAALRHTGRVTVRAFGRVAMAFGVACALFIGAFATSETVRVNTMNLIVETFGEHTAFQFASVSDNNVPQIRAGWVPEGFELTDSGYDEMGSWFKYQGPGAQSIYGNYYIGEGDIVRVDTENSEVIRTQVQGNEATLAVKESRLQVIWVMPDKKGFVDIYAEGLTTEELLQLAENIEYYR